MKLYSITGQEVATLVDGVASAGEYRYCFNASNFAAGTNIYSLTAGNQTEVIKMVLIKEASLSNIQIEYKKPLRFLGGFFYTGVVLK